MPFFQNAQPLLFGFAKANRKKPTSAEKRLWNALRAGKLGGYKFRRQHPYCLIIIDFYCHEAKLAIEIDGPYHLNDSTILEKDQERDFWLNDQGIRTLRFSNKEVQTQLPKIIEIIKTHLPSPKGEGPGER